MLSAAGAGQVVVGLFLAGLFAVVATQILGGVINMRQLLYGRTAKDRLYFSPERVQLLAITVWVAFNYFLTVLNNPTVLPDVPSNTIALLGGSHFIYLGGKAISRFAPGNSP